MPPKGRKSRARRVLGVIGAVVGTTVTFVTSAAAATVLHLDVPATRRLVATQVNGILHHQFAGDVAIERIGSLSLRGLSGVRFRVKDPTGLQVLLVDGARVRIRPIDAARSALFDKGDILVPIEFVSLDHVDANISGDAAGNLRIANAFAERTPTPPKPKDPNARGVRVDAPSVTLQRAWIHGQAPGAPPLDAELHDLLARAHYDEKLTKADIDRVDLITRGLPRGVDPHGRVGAHLSMPSATGQSMGVTAAFDGVIAGIPTSAQAHLDGQRVDAVVDGRDPAGQGVRSTFGEVSIQEDVTLHAEAHGVLPRIAAKAHVVVGRGTVDVDGNVDTSSGTKAAATVMVRHIDVHGIVPSAPESDVGLDTHANVFIAQSGEIRGDIVLETLPGMLAGEALPVVKLRGEFTKDTAHANGRIIDPRATANFDVDLTTVSANQVIEARLHTELADLSRLPKVGGAMKGHATVDANGTMNMGTKAFAARAHVAAGGMAYGAQTVDNATVLATASGTTDHPVVEVGVHAGGIMAGGQKIAVADIRGQIEPGAVTTIRDAQVDIVKEGRTLSAVAHRVQIGGPRMSVDGAVISGLGEPIHADLSRDSQEVHIKLDAPSIDLASVALIAGKPAAVRSGQLSMTGDVALRRNSATGELHARVDSLSAAQIHDASMSVDARLSHQSVGLQIKAELAEAGTFELATNDITIGGSPLEASSWKHAHGRAKFDANLDLKKLATLAPDGALPVSELSGQLVVAGVVRRESASVPPEIGVHVHTRGLVIAGKGQPEPDHDVVHGEKVTGVEPWRSEGVDVSLDARMDPTSGFGELAFHAVDKKGTLVGFDAKSDLPYAQMIADPSTALALLERAPMRAKLVIPKRALEDLPQLAGTHGFPGTVEAELDISGSALDPRVDLVAHARGVRSPAVPAKMAADLDLTLGYDGEHADLLGKVSAEKHEALEVSSRIDIRARDLVLPTSGQPLAWQGSAKVKLARFPVDAVNAIADRQIRGHISGEAVLEELHKDAKLHAQIDLDGLKIGRATYEKGTIVLDTRSGKVTADARIDQKDGYLDGKASTGLTWGDALAPSLDPAASTEAHVEAKGFRAAAILPFVQSALNELDGRIDANATVKLSPGLKDPTMEGTVAFHDGTVQLVALGEEFKNVKANVSFQPGGVIKVDNVYMTGTDGQLNADAVIKTRGLALDSAIANVHIPKHRALDLAMQGQPIGKVSGDVKLVATNSEDGKTMKVNVDVPTLELALPQKIKSGVQELSEKTNIRVGVFRDPKTFIKLPLDKDDLEPPKAEKQASAVIDVDVRLGEITVVQGNQARVVLGGNPHIRVAGTTQVTGQIQVKQGKVDVQGKSFQVERGTITFQPEDASNPIIVATATWTAEDGTHIFADFVGPVKTGKVTLRSDPARPRNEILAIILFGTSDGANAAPPPQGRAPDGTTKAAVGVGGGFAAQGLTEALDDLTGIEATAKIDTTRSSNPAPEIEIQLARRISIAFEHVLGNPPISEPDTNLATVDWRFRANWSLEATFGDRGLLQTDAVWQKRY